MSLRILHANNASSLVAGGGISATDTALTVTTGEGSKFPSSGDFKLTIASEIVVCTARSGDVLTIVRGQEGTTAASHAAGVAVNAYITADSILRLRKDANFVTEVVVSGATTLTSAHFNRVIRVTGSTNYTITLPAISGNQGEWIAFQIDQGYSGRVTLDGNGTETINGRTTRVMWFGEFAVLYVGASEWEKRGGITRPMSCGLYQATTLFVANATEATPPFDGLGWDYGGMSAGDGTIITRRYGAYQWYCSVPFANVLAGSINSLGMAFRNGDPIGGRDWWPWSAGWYPAIRHYGRSDEFEIGDVFRFDVYHTSGQTESVVTSASYADQGARMSLLEIPSW